MFISEIYQILTLNDMRRLYVDINYIKPKINTKTSTGIFLRHVGRL